AALRRVVERLPEGLATRLGEGGARVSGGEGQRVRLARALVRNRARLAILDEPFRALDRETRRMLLDRALAHWKGTTVLCVTHRLAETKSFDRILILEDGRIIEDGRPKELLTRPKSLYAQFLQAEEEVLRAQWQGAEWRRVWVEGGRIDGERSVSKD